LFERDDRRLRAHELGMGAWKKVLQRQLKLL